MGRQSYFRVTVPLFITTLLQCSFSTCADWFPFSWWRPKPPPSSPMPRNGTAHRTRPQLQVNACQMKADFIRAKGDCRMGISAQIIPSWHFGPIVSLAFWTRSRNVSFIYSGNSPIKRDFKSTYGPCVCSVSVKLKCPSYTGDVFNNTDFPLSLGSPPRSLTLWILLAARATRSDQYDLKYRANIWSSQRATLPLHLGR